MRTMKNSLDANLIYEIRLDSRSQNLSRTKPFRWLSGGLPWRTYKHGAVSR